MAGDEKHPWRGLLYSVQPRINLLRSFDQRSHAYLGYTLSVEGTIGGEERAFSVGIGEAAQKKHGFKAGLFVRGKSVPVRDKRANAVEFYKTSSLEVIEDTGFMDKIPPPWTGAPPDLTTFRSRGHRRLDPRAYARKCLSCIWGCRMAVEITIDHWNPDKKKYRFETFCYGPKSCFLYTAGPTRKVPGRKGMVWEEADWVDEDATSHRGPNE